MSTAAAAITTSISRPTLDLQQHVVPKPPHPFIPVVQSQENYNYERELEKLQAGAFRSLLQHLQYHSNDISNIDLMTVSGFCRNCLAKVCILCILCNVIQYEICVCAVCVHFPLLAKQIYLFESSSTLTQFCFLLSF